MTPHNKFEKKINRVIHKVINVQLEYEYETLIATKVLKQASNKNKLFFETGSPYPTITGRQKRTEIVLHCPDSGIDWRIECKSRQSIGLIGQITTELQYVAQIPEKLYCLVFNDVLDNPYILNQIQEQIDLRELNDRVWYGTAKQFKKKLKKAIN